ncbi:MAG: hypothetical protein KAJ19_08395 [Gammaproteobacteria bacterium]|nr:hypothetical protein [Gammaproteobacteria bacterium]
MTELYEGSIQVDIGYAQPDLDDLKSQVDDIIYSGSEKATNTEAQDSIDKMMKAIIAAMYTGLLNAGMFIAKTASDNAPELTGRLKKSGSVWIQNKRIYITGGGTHPDHVDTGEFSAIIIFNTPYAFIQDTEYWFRHPRGGRAGYLTGTFDENHSIIQEIMFNPLRAALE